MPVTPHADREDPLTQPDDSGLLTELEHLYEEIQRERKRRIQAEHRWMPAMRLPDEHDVYLVRIERDRDGLGSYEVKEYDPLSGWKNMWEGASITHWKPITPP